MDNTTVAFIGCGNMARSLIGGLIANKLNPSQLFAADPNQPQREAMHEQFGIEVYADNQAAVDQAEVVVLAVKPQIMSDVLNSFSSIKDKLIISIAAGITLDSIQLGLNETAAVVRVMPNTPALIQAGAAALIANEECSEAQKNIAESMMRSVGTAIWLDNESQMDAVTALSGSGPAYFFYFMEAMEKAAMEMGITENQARLLTIETALGAAKMALLSSHDPAKLRQDVTSPGGTTEAALNTFDDNQLTQIIVKAMQAAQLRSQQLSKEFGN